MNFFLFEAFVFHYDTKFEIFAQPASNRETNFESCLLFLNLRNTRNVPEKCVMFDTAFPKMFTCRFVV